MSFLTEVNNPHLDLPQDLLKPLYYVFGWAAAHHIIVNYVLKPMSVKWIQPKPTEKTLKPSDSGVEITQEGLRQRKTGSFSTETEPSPEQEEQEEDKKIKGDRVKFVISGWKFFQYFSMMVLGIYVLHAQTWTFQPWSWFQGWPHKHTMGNAEKFYYHIQFGMNFYGFFDLFRQPKQKDFPAMVVHHLTTLFLVYTSYIWSFHRIGCVILLIHDVADPFMEVAKCFLYIGKQKAADAFFLAFAVIFIISRNVIFPGYIISSIPLYAFLPNGDVLPNYTVCVSAFLALCILEVLHIYWTYLILNVAYKAVAKNGVQGDVRDDDDD